MALVLSRKPKQGIIFDGGISVHVAYVQPNRVGLAIQAPRGVRIIRDELSGKEDFMSVIKPTIGRVLHYWRPGQIRAVDQPLPAIVTHVFSDTCINVAIFEEDGKPMASPPTSVRLLQEGEAEPADCGYCTWMAYQLGQAAKTEAAEQALAGAKL